MFRCCFPKPKIEPEEQRAKELSNAGDDETTDRPTRKTFAELSRPHPVTIARPNNKSDEDIVIIK